MDHRKEESGSMDISNVQKSSENGSVLGADGGSEGGEKATEPGRAPRFRAPTGVSSLQQRQHPHHKFYCSGSLKSHLLTLATVLDKKILYITVSFSENTNKDRKKAHKGSTAGMNRSKSRQKEGAMRCPWNVLRCEERKREFGHLLKIDAKRHMKF